LIDRDAEIEIPIEPLRRREPAAFAMLVERHQPLVLGLCQSMGLRGADLDDAAAEVFANVFRAIPGFEARSTVGTWVYRIACRTIGRMRARNRRAVGSELPSEHPDAGQPSPLRQSEDAETYQRLWDAVAELDEREAMAIEMHYRRDWPVEQIADVLECPQGTVKTLLFRARDKLRRKLARQEIANP
jgi:RNA polymerase sigma-70 factor (ECF subfamily)